MNKNIYIRKFKNIIKFLQKKALSIIFIGNKRKCPVCEKNYRTFLNYGNPIRKDALCINCGSLERHRFSWEYLKKYTNLFDNSEKTFLHVAPEKMLQKKLNSLLGDSYISADLYQNNVKVKMDITDIQFPNNSFDVIYCNHVLEHVNDDKKAMSEFYRVLKNEGWAILSVPITVEKTYEDPTITDPQKRLELFGQIDHVRRYGYDFIDRLKEAGFNVKEIKVSDIFSDNEAIYFGFKNNSGSIFYCTK